MQNEVKEPAPKDVIITDVCEHCHREYVLNEFNTQSADVSLCDECYRALLAQKKGGCDGE